MADKKMVCVVRIKGKVGLDRKLKETLDRLRLKRKYSCVVLISPKKEEESMIKKVRNLVAFGNIDEKTFAELIEKRGQVIDKSKKLNAKSVAGEISNGKSYKEANLKPFFRLHPPRRGIESKKPVGTGKGVLGNHGDKINELLRRML